MHPKTILIRRLRTPLLIPLLRTQIQQHDRDRLPLFPLATPRLGAPLDVRHGIEVCEFVALSAVGTTPCIGVLVEGLGHAGGVKAVCGAGLPAVIGDAAAGILVAVEVVARGGCGAGGVGP